MNKRYEQLLAQAHIEFAPDSQAVTKRFAELIVRECAKIAEKEQAFNARYTDADKHPQVNIDQCILIEFGL